MKQYILTKRGDSLCLINNGKPCPILDILHIYPHTRVYAFEGYMGAGKTTFIKQLCEAMGVVEVVNSPTFAIVNVYEGLNGEINHFDCYRLKSIREAYDLGAEEYIESGDYCFIEWPEIIEQLLPDDAVRVSIVEQENGDRVLTLSPYFQHT